jgi:hypothetical protein
MTEVDKPFKQIWGDGARKTWYDGRKQKVEEALNGVIAGLVKVAETKRRHEIEMERQRREWAEAERQRFEFEQRRREEAEQLKALEYEAALWARSQQLRAYIDAARIGVRHKRRVVLPPEGLAIRQMGQQSIS